ncbi:receptor-type tyrosine-protein phosphatase F-like [Orbicella faveolata]|uniref:receptor-type tyrosine-protein phosphatase F-like n=1 Tax=Orbicella faveolata TaxID=48498 RepID=UPI0009E31864|nr:receptor-type tyrosine-protein phosphatase F-like [Orbicella faveolata]
MEFGTEVNSYNIIDLKRYQSYRVYVAGRSHGGVGVENYEEAMTDEDVPTKGPTKLIVHATGSSSLRAEWGVVPLCCRYGIIRGYQVLLLDHESREVVTNVAVSESTLSFEFHSLLTFYAYDVSVAAFTIKGSGVASENGTVTGEAGMLISLSTY